MPRTHNSHVNLSVRFIYSQLSGCLLVLGLGCSVASAQQRLSGVHYEVEAGTFLSTGSTNPFWVRSNQFGEIPLSSPGVSLRGQVKKEYASAAGKTFSYGYGARAVVNAGATNQVLISELYAKLRYGPLEFSAGRRREVLGLVDTLLSSGSYIWSGNALPLPKLQLAMPHYTPILKSGLVAIKGNFAHGWFGTGDSVQNYFLHQKSLYVRIGKPSWRFKFHGGFNHQVQWGGTLRSSRYDSGVKINRYGSDLESYWYVITGKSLYATNGIPLIPQDGKASAEGGNRVGNHLGTLDIGLEYEDEKSRWLLYRQAIYEDGSLFYLNNISDGLVGVSVRRKKATSGVLHVVLEYLHTSNQGGNIDAARTSDEQLRGVDDYFNNGRYLDGWTYKGQTIGTPFIMPLRYTTGLSPQLAANPNLIVNNRVDAILLSMKSRVKKVDLVTRLAVSENLGNFNIPLHITQTSVQQQLIVPIKQYVLTAIIAYDNAGVLKQNLGLSLFARRSF